VLAVPHKKETHIESGTFVCESSGGYGRDVFLRIFVVGQQFCLRKFIKRPDNGRILFTADGNSLNVLGVLEMSIDINELRIPFPFYVIRNLKI